LLALVGRGKLRNRYETLSAVADTHLCSGVRTCMEIVLARPRGFFSIYFHRPFSFFPVEFAHNGGRSHVRRIVHVQRPTSAVDQYQTAGSGSFACLPGGRLQFLRFHSRLWLWPSAGWGLTWCDGIALRRKDRTVVRAEVIQQTDIYNNLQYYFWICYFIIFFLLLFIIRSAFTSHVHRIAIINVFTGKCHK